MFKFKPSIITALTLAGIMAAINAAADTNMAPPPPLNNKVFESMVGTWQGESNMMGTPMHDTLKIHWALNHQFIIMDLTAVSPKQSTMKYEGMGVFGVNAQGQAKTWWFDNWGAETVSTGIGTFGDNSLTLQDSNTMFSETRSFQLNGNQMTMHAKGTMSWQGKQNNFDETTVYSKS